jgi:hypothetical protein
MSPLLPSDPELLKQVLAPLLEDFHYWFSRSRTLLESVQLDCLSIDDQEQLLDRLVNAQREVSVAQSLLAATDGQAGVEMTLLMSWHKLVAECWAISMKHRAQAAL